MAASSSQPETMKAECSLDNPKVYSFFLILFIISCILFLLHYIQCHFMAFEEDLRLLGDVSQKEILKVARCCVKTAFIKRAENYMQWCDRVLLVHGCGENQE